MVEVARHVFTHTVTVGGRYLRIQIRLVVEIVEEGLEEDDIGDEGSYMERDLDDDIPEGFPDDDYGGLGISSSKSRSMPSSSSTSSLCIPMSSSIIPSPSAASITTRSKIEHRVVWILMDQTGGVCEDNARYERGGSGARRGPRPPPPRWGYRHPNHVPCLHPLLLPLSASLCHQGEGIMDDDIGMQREEVEEDEGMERDLDDDIPNAEEDRHTGLSPHSHHRGNLQGCHHPSRAPYMTLHLQCCE
jgi:hypothetical protein